MRIVTIVGARPQFVKAAVFSRAVDDWNRSNPSKPIEEVLVHTGQHHDENMSKVFFDQLNIRHPAHNLEISGGPHGAMTGKMLSSIEKVLQETSPDWLMVYGDTNSTLAGALAAAKLNIPIAHVEAGLRSFNRRMPEEINRVLTDHVSSLLFCPTDGAVENLKCEGIIKGVSNVGDVMLDASLYYKDQAEQTSKVLTTLNLKPKKYVLVTCHRAENTDDLTRLINIFTALGEIAKSHQVVLPLHPRTRKVLLENNLEHLLEPLLAVEPVPFLDMIALESGASVIITDSGGVQKEAFFFKVPCVTIRDETEWKETVATGWNQLAGADRNQILTCLGQAKSPESWRPLYGNGNAGCEILDLLQKAYLCSR